MPRLIPRLLKAIARGEHLSGKYSGPLVSSKPRQRPSLWRPAKASYDFTPGTRTRSFLFDEENPVIAPYLYKRHKKLPPSLQLKDKSSKELTGDEAREMSEEERSWWASPYLRMLSSPIRQCRQTEAFLPTDFLVRLTRLRLAESIDGNGLAVFPDGLQHPRFKNRVYNMGRYILCWKEAVSIIIGMKFKKMKTIHHALLLEQIGHLLRLRVLQELEMLAARLKAAPRSMAEHTVLRRLTRAEWSELKDGRKVPWKDAACIIVVPPPKGRKNVTQESLQASANELPPPPEVQVSGGPLRQRELAELLTVSNSQPIHDSSVDSRLVASLPPARVPLFHSGGLFPGTAQRAALHIGLCNILNIERQARLRAKLVSPKNSNAPKDQQKGSHAFLLTSNANTVLRVDTVPLAVALWRLWMWEGGTWEGRRQSIQGD